MTGDRVVRVLLIDDNPMDVRATMHAARQGRAADHIEVAADGDAALELLHTTVDGPSRPDLVLLDLDLPGRDGWHVLAEMKAEPRLRRIPVVVLTTSDADADVIRAYELGASAYVTKPVDIDGWSRLISSIESFWSAVVTPPPA